MKRILILSFYLYLHLYCLSSVYAQEEYYVLSPDIHCLIGQSLNDTEVEDFLAGFDLSADILLSSEDKLLETEYDFDYAGLFISFYLNIEQSTLEAIGFSIDKIESGWSQLSDIAEFWGVHSDYQTTKANNNLYVYDEENSDGEIVIYAKLIPGGADHLTLWFEEDESGTYTLNFVKIEKVEGDDLEQCIEEENEYAADEIGEQDDDDVFVEEADYVETSADDGEELEQYTDEEIDYSIYEDGNQEEKTPELSAQNEDQAEIQFDFSFLEEFLEEDKQNSASDTSFENTSQAEIKRFTGNIVNDKPQGYGMLNLDRQSNNIIKVASNFNAGVPDSPGQLFYRNGDRYDGEFIYRNGGMLNIIREGRGRQHYTNGEYYEGSWKNDKWDHSGTWIKANGDRYVGSFEDGKPDGWVVVRINDKLSIHAFDKGKIDPSRQSEVDKWYDGHFPHEDTDPLLQQYGLATRMFDRGCMFGDCENGIGISFYGALDRIYLGPHQYGKPNGTGEMFVFDSDAITYKGPFKDGKLHGMIRRESSHSVYLDRIFYEGRIEHGFYNSMEQFEAILAKEVEQIKKEIAKKPKATIKYIYSDDNDDSESSSSWRESVYDACLSGDCENGFASIAFGNGDSYMGNMKNGQFHGDGHLSIFSTKHEYYGNFQNGALHGEGSLYDRYRNKLEGRWEYNKIISGSGYNSDGCKVYDGIFSNGVLVSKTYQSSDCSFTTESVIEEAPAYVPQSSGSGGWTQKTIIYNKGTGNQWSVTIPVRK